MSRPLVLLLILTFAGAAAGHALGATWLSTGGPMSPQAERVFAAFSHPAAVVLGALRGWPMQQEASIALHLQGFLLTCTLLGAAVGALFHLRLSARAASRPKSPPNEPEPPPQPQ